MHVKHAAPSFNIFMGFSEDLSYEYSLYTKNYVCVLKGGGRGLNHYKIFLNFSWIFQHSSRESFCLSLHSSEPNFIRIHARGVGVGHK